MVGAFGTLDDFGDAAGVTGVADLAFTGDETDVVLVVVDFDDELDEGVDFVELDVLDFEDDFDELDFDEDDDFDEELRDEIELAKFLPPWYKRIFAAHNPIPLPSLCILLYRKLTRHLLTPRAQPQYSLLWQSIEMV